MIKISKESCPLKVSKFFCKGVLQFFVLSNKEAIFPVPWFTRLSEKTMFFV